MLYMSVTMSSGTITLNMNVSLRIRLLSGPLERVDRATMFVRMGV